MAWYAPAQYASLYPGRDRLQGDINSDGLLNEVDASLLAQLLTYSCP